MSGLPPGQPRQRALLQWLRHPAHLAARMEQMADPGTIIVAPSTLRLAEGAVQVASLGARPIKGRDAPIEGSELVGGGPARTKLPPTGRQHLSGCIGGGAARARPASPPRGAGGGQGARAAGSRAA